MSRLVYIVDWLPPDFGAIGQYALSESEARAAAGDDVALVGLTTGPSSTTSVVLGRGRLTIIRLHSAAPDKVRYARRALWTALTDVRLLWASRAHFAAADEILFTASPPFLDHLITPLGRLSGKDVVFRIADFHPECLMAELDRVPTWLAMFQRLAVFWRLHGGRIEVLGDDQRRLLESQGIPSDRIVVRRSESPVRIPRHTPPAEVPRPLEGRVLLLYSGAVAHPHDCDTFVEGYRLHHQTGSGRVGFWLNATGAKADQFEADIRAARSPVHRSAPVPLDRLPSLLVTPAAHLITLRDRYVGLVVPSKVYACLESGRDILFIGSEAADVHGLCRDALGPEAYRRVAVGDPWGVAAALEHIADRARGRVAAAPE